MVYLKSDSAFLNLVFESANKVSNDEISD